MFLLFYINKMQEQGRRLQVLLTFLTKRGIYIGEWPVFVGECHFIFFNTGNILLITSLKKEKLFILILADRLCATACVFAAWGIGLIARLLLRCVVL